MRNSMSPIKESILYKINKKQLPSYLKSKLEIRFTEMGNPKI